MTLNKNIYAEAVKEFLDDLTDEQKDDPEYVWKGLGEILFDHLKDYGEIFNITVNTATGEQEGTGNIK